MRILVAAADDVLADYLRDAGHKTKTLYVNDLAIRAAREYKADVVLYQTTVTAASNHEDVIKELHDNGFRVVLVADPSDQLVIYALALGIKDLLLFPVEPASILYRIENPATVDDVAQLVRKCNPMNQIAGINTASVKEEKSSNLFSRFKKGTKKQNPGDEGALFSQSTPGKYTKPVIDSNDGTGLVRPITPPVKLNTRRRELAGNTGGKDIQSNPFSSRANLLDYSKNVHIVTGDKETEVYDHIVKTRVPTVVIDACSGRIACKLGVETNSMWEHDWRIGIAALPAKIGKNLEVYCNPVEQDIPDWEDRDVRAMYDIIDSALKKKKKVIVIAEEGLVEMLNKRQSTICERS